MKIPKTKYFMILFVLLFVNSAFVCRDLDLIKEKTFNVIPGQLLNVLTDAGDIVIKSWEMNEVSVKIYGDTDAENKMEFSFDQDEKGVTVIGEKEGGKLLGWLSSIDLKYEIIVPEEFDLDLKTAGGDITSREIKGDFELKTSGGDIYMKDIKH